MTTRPEAATSLLKASPIERTVYSQDISSDGSSSKSVWESEVDLSGPIARPVDPLPADEATPTPAFNDLGISQKNFTLHVFLPNANYKHGEEIRKNPIHGRWPGGHRNETFISAALRRVVPSGAMAPALRDWETGNQLAHDGDGFSTGEEGAAAALLGQKRHSASEVFFLERIRRREEEQETPKIMTSLLQFAEDCKTQSRSSPDLAESSQITTVKDSDNQWNISPPNPGSRGQKPDALLDSASFKKLLKE